MPAILTHYTFAKQNFNYEDRYFSLTALGAQGPDVFFFYGHPHKKRYHEDSPNVRQFGTYLHSIDISVAYNFLLEYANKSENPYLYHSFIKGLFAHYILDRNAHPYVFYRTGFSDNAELANKFSCYHVKFEAILDRLYATQQKTFKAPVKCIKAKDREVVLISKMMAELAKHLNYSGINENTYYVSWLDMKASEKALYSPTGIKNAIAHLILKGNFSECMMTPHFVGKFEKYDILNSKHAYWHHPQKEEVCSLSFNDIAYKAREELKEIESILALSRGGIPVFDQLKAFVKNINHDGNVIGQMRKYMDVCFEK